MKVFSLLLSIFFCHFTNAQSKYKTLNGRIDFSSVKGMNLLEAFSENVYFNFDPKTKNINLKVQITSFNFTNCSKQVEKTFNDIYMESHKYHWAKFEGKISDSLNLKSQESTELLVEGKLFIHGVEQTRKIKGIMIAKPDNSLVFRAKFPVVLSNHGISILNEDIDKLANTIEVSVYAELKPDK